MTDHPADIVRRQFQAFNDDDRAAGAALIAEDFRFTSPLDNGVDRASYVVRCWPGDHGVGDFRIEQQFVDGDTVVTIFEAGTKDGRRLRNMGMDRVRDGKIYESECYFGWSLPHRAAPGGFVQQS